MIIELTKDLRWQVHLLKTVRWMYLLPLISFYLVNLVILMPFPDCVKIYTLMIRVEIGPGVFLSLHPIMCYDAEIGVADQTLVN